jgi:Na+/pantothenate symporter
MSTHRSSRTRYADPTQSLFLGTAIMFAGVILGGVGVIQVIQGIAAVAKDTIFVSGVDYAYRFDITTWGWIHIVLGVIACAVSIGILTGRRWGILGGIGIAIVSAVLSFLFLPQYPAGAITILVFDVLVLWALTTELRSQP